MSESTIHPHSPMPTALVSRPGIMQQSLRASLAACPGIEIVGAYGDGLTALNAVAEHAPALLVIDCNLLDEEVAALLAAVKAHYATTHCVVLTRSGQRAAWARASGADAVVPHGASMQELMAVLAHFQELPINHQPSQQGN
jgi:DNA-binding NarL/FixJ family response regulator